MTGLELSRQSFEKYGRELIRRFPDCEGRVAAGLFGRGSECFGCDDELSRDHDFAPGFYLLLSRDDYAVFGSAMQAGYAALPISPPAAQSLYGRLRGVRCTDEYFAELIGCPGVPERWQDWLAAPEYALAEATNGELFYDPAGLVTDIRRRLGPDMPQDIRLKKLAAALALAAQSGQYNFSRCLGHGEEAAAQLALARFAEYTAAAVFLLNRAHAPYYKWTLHLMRRLPILGSLADTLDYLLTAELTPQTHALKRELIEDVCAALIAQLKTLDLSDSGHDYLEAHAISVTERIRDPELRALHLMTGI